MRLDEAVPDGKSPLKSHRVRRTSETPSMPISARTPLAAFAVGGSLLLGLAGTLAAAPAARAAGLGVTGTHGTTSTAPATADPSDAPTPTPTPSPSRSGPPPVTGGSGGLLDDLALTGAGKAVPLAIGGAAVLVAGAGMVLVARRRRA
ncbi:hypothetical protein [Streptomyces sp. RerS4]|uniref:hypothetical protein n=1 Tax=Streptomyces sp. RerS4 TaxID=2942449 RepID=UPI00201C9E1A|nr:hypothetical protein [Streptomyces sp. RerS4]UQW99770.1 hypothetical protein M4D82_03875 [Streptomyces sp. RerS4]